MNPAERAAIDKWMAERDIASLDDLTVFIEREKKDAYGSGYNDSEDEHVDDGPSAGSVYEGTELTKALADAIEEQADDIAREAKDDTLWLHAPLVAGRLLQHPAVRRAFGGS